MTKSTYYNQTVNGERPMLRSFGGTTPALTPKEKMETIKATSVSDNYNVNVVDVGGKKFTISDTTGQVEIDPADLTTMSDFHYDDELDKQVKKTRAKRASGGGVEGAQAKRRQKRRSGPLREKRAAERANRAQRRRVLLR
jgi:flagellar biogenesis protein FliO